MIKAIIFDWDGVLVDSEPIFKRVEQALLKEVWGQSPGDLTPEAADALIADLIRDMSGMGTVAAMGLCRERLNLGVPLPQLIEEYHSRIQPAYQQSPLIPHALEMVRRLRPHVKLGLATSSRRPLVEPLLQSTGVAALMDVVVSADDVGGAAKPAPDVYLRAIEKLQLSPQDCIAVEDTPVGVRAAIAAGCRCVAIPRRETLFGDFQAATRIVRTIEDLKPEFFEQMDHAPVPEDLGKPVVVYARSQALRRADALIHLQLEAGASMARQHGFEVVERLFDIDRGLQWPDRPGLARVFQLAASERIKGVLVTEPNILDAATLHQAHIIQTLLGHDVHVMAVFRKEPYASVGARWN